MTKSTWIEVIKKHTQPLQDGLYGVKEQGGRKGYIEILVKDARQEVNVNSSYAGLQGDRLQVDSDDLLVLFHDQADVISYVLWQDIRSIRFVWPER